MQTEPNTLHPALVAATRPKTITYWHLNDGGDLLEVNGMGLWVRESQWVAFTGGDLPYDVLMHLVFDGTTTRCDDLRLRQRPDGRPISLTPLRRIRVEALIRLANDQRVVFTGKPGEPMAATYGDGEVGDRYRKGLSALAAQGRRRTPDDELEAVAKVYRAAVAAGEPPTAAVERELKMSNRNLAKKRVHQARAAGKLPPAPGERRGGIAASVSTRKKAR